MVFPERPRARAGSDAESQKLVWHELLSRQKPAEDVGARSSGSDVEVSEEAEGSSVDRDKLVLTMDMDKGFATSSNSNLWFVHHCCFAYCSVS